MNHKRAEQSVQPEPRAARFLISTLVGRGPVNRGVIIPVVNIVWWLYLATSEWPIERELAERPEPDQRTQEDHITLMLRRAETCEKRGDFAEALELFEILGNELDGRPGSHFAKHCANRLRERIAAT
jgi:hypothetical protein